MNNKEFSRILEGRTRNYAVQVFRFMALLPDTTEWRVIKRQSVRAGTSVGANYAEANRARSKADFRSKIRICEGECNESIYWLTLIKDLLPDSTDINPIIKEGKELLSIFTTISKNTKL